MLKLKHFEVRNFGSDRVYQIVADQRKPASRQEALEYADRSAKLANKLRNFNHKFENSAALDEIMARLELENHREVQQLKKSKLVGDLLSQLTTKQRHALEAVYLHNPKRLPLKAIARRIGIKESLLKDRLEGARKKLGTSLP